MPSKPEEEDGVLFFRRETFNPDTNEYTLRISIVDDKALDPKSLSKRRLLLAEQGVRLYQLKKAVFMLGDFIRLTNSTYWWIDSSGKVFQYKKQTRAKLTSKKITKCIPCGLGSIVEVAGSAKRFKTLYKVPPDHFYASVLSFNKSDILYGTSDVPIKDTWRIV